MKSWPQWFADRRVGKFQNPCGFHRAASRIDARRGETGTGSIGAADESLTLEEGDAQ